MSSDDIRADKTKDESHVDNTCNSKALVERSKTRLRGFAAWPKDKLQKVASRGGVAAHAAGTAHEWTTQEATVAGAKGGRATQKKWAAKKLAAKNQLPLPEVEK